MIDNLILLFVGFVINVQKALIKIFVSFDKKIETTN